MYHEYSNNGRIVRRHYSGARLGESETINTDSFVMSDNALYWQRRAEEKIEILGEWLGEYYSLWMEVAFPGDANQYTWRQFFEVTNMAVSAGREALLRELECTCLPDGSYTCPVCAASARLATNREECSEGN